jgi:hypothetical protein
MSWLNMSIREASHAAQTVQYPAPLSPHSKMPRRSPHEYTVTLNRNSLPMCLQNIVLLVSRNQKLRYVLYHVLQLRTLNFIRNFLSGNKKVKQSLWGQGRRFWGFQRVQALRFLDNRHMKVVRLSALRTEHLYPPPLPQEIFLVFIYV